MSPLRLGYTCSLYHTGNTRQIILSGVLNKSSRNTPVVVLYYMCTTRLSPGCDPLGFHIYLPKQGTTPPPIPSATTPTALQTLAQFEFDYDY
jgi:hypothetical protein